jgi:zinc protease
MTQPRRDPEAITAWNTRMRASLANRDARPETVFRDEMMVVTSGGHYRRRPASGERLDEIDVDVAFDVYRERFADASDFTFVIVGNFDPEALEPVVQTYLGGLPASGRMETWRDIGVTPPDGVVRVEVNKGLEPKSQVEMRFRTDAEWSREASHEIASLAAALQIRLREVLREEMGATYGVRVGGGISRRPRQLSGFSVSFGCAPENVEEMIQAVFDAIEAIKENGVAKDDIVKVRETQTRGRETALKENGFWLGALSNAYRFETDPRLILAYDELVELVTSKQLQAAAHRYIDTDTYVLGVLYPEAADAAPQP